MVVRSEQRVSRVLSPNDERSLEHKIPAAENAPSASMEYGCRWDGHQVVEGLLQATTTLSSCCEQCHLRFDGCLQLSVCIWWWRDDRRERTLWHLHWQLKPLTESQFRDVTSDVIILVVHVLAPNRQTGGTQSALWLWPTYDATSHARNTTRTLYGGSGAYTG